jgi:Arc/MetJ-type ribon-helix-helix transcriptional regulator
MLAITIEERGDTMNNRTRNWLIVGIIVVVGIVSGYYVGTFRPNETIIINSERLLHEGASLLKRTGNIGIARKNVAWVEAGLPALKSWYAFPTHRARGNRLIEAKESLKERIDEREDLQKSATSTVDDLLSKEEFEKANQELQSIMMKTGAQDEVMKALLGRIQDSFAEHLKNDVKSKVGTGNYQEAMDALDAAVQNPLGEKCDSAQLLSVIQDSFAEHLKNDVKSKVGTGNYQEAMDALDVAVQNPLGEKCDSAQLMSVIQNGYYVHVAGQVNSEIKAGEYGRADEIIKTALKSPLGENLNFNKLSSVIDRMSVQDFAGAEKVLRDTGLARGNSDLQKEIAEIVRLGKEANITKQALIAEKVEDLIKNTHTPIQGFPQLQGKVMVWDYTKKTVEQAYEMLKDDLRASPHDAQFTVFGIRRRWDETIGRYSISNQPALREYMEIGVVYWPSMTCPGYAKIEGGSPPAVRPVTYVPGRGSSVNIKNWIEGNSRK